jgi:CRP-like cAMP-binding protein
MNFFIEVAQLTSGQSFGELALLNSDPRNAKVHCLTDCVFATLNKQSFMKVMKNVE